MRINNFHFPFFIFASLGILLCSCRKEIDEKDIVNPVYQEAYSKAVVFDSIGQSDSAYFYYNKAKLSCSSQEVRRKTYVLVKMSGIQLKFCDYSGSQENCTEAFKIIGDDTSYHPSLHTLLGIIYEETFDYEKALASYNEVLKN